MLELKVTLLSVGQSAWLPKVVFDNNVYKYIDKNTNEVIARVFTLVDTDLYALDVILVLQKVAANLILNPSCSINIDILHRCLGHLSIDNCCLMVNWKMVDGVDWVVGKEEFCKGCTHG
jgi:hypothetical protein